MTALSTTFGLATEAATIDDLLSDGRDAGFPATRRLVWDWVGVGLLDHPTRRSLGRGKGSDKALWLPEQRNLFRHLVALRGHQKTLRPLYEAVIMLWVLGPVEAGAELIPTRQAVRALRAWARQPSKSKARNSAREVLKVFGATDTSARQHKKLLDKVTDAIYCETLDDPAELATDIRDLLQSVAQPEDIPVLDRVVTPESYARLITVRVRGIHHARRVTVDELERARLWYHADHSSIDEARRRAGATAERSLPGFSLGALAEPNAEDRYRAVTRDLVTVLGLMEGAGLRTETVGKGDQGLSVN